MPGHLRRARGRLHLLLPDLVGDLVLHALRGLRLGARLPARGARRRAARARGATARLWAGKGGGFSAACEDRVDGSEHRADGCLHRADERKIELMFAYIERMEGNIERMEGNTSGCLLTWKECLLISSR